LLDARMVGWLAGWVDMGMEGGHGCVQGPWMDRGRDVSTGRLMDQWVD